LGIGRRRWTNKARELRAQGMNYTKIGVVVGKSQASVWRVLNEEYARARDTAYHQANKEKIRARQATHRLANKEKIKVSGAIYYQANKERFRERDAAYRQANRERTEAYRQANREKLKEKGRIYYHVNKNKKGFREKNNARHAIYRRNHRSENNADCSKRRALIAGVAIGNLAEIVEIFRRAREDLKIRCYLCGKWIPIGQRNVDHIVPLSQGGQHRPSNLAVACASCNMSKGSKMPSTIGLLL